MNSNRRTVLQASAGLTVLGLAVSAGLIRPQTAFATTAYPEKAFSAKLLEELMKTMGSALPVESKEINLVVPDIAENGASVAVGVESRLKNVTEISILIPNNFSLLAAQFMIPAGTDAQVHTRLKMARTSDVIALVKADGKYYFAKKEVRITLGGCAA